MIYIKNTNGVVTLAGTVADERMLADGYFAYTGNIPVLTNDFQAYKLVNNVLTIVEDTVSKSSYDRSMAKESRDASLSAITHTLADGSIYQVRPSDIANFQLAITIGTDAEWVLEDNSVRLTTVTELQEILDSGISQGIAIWNTYTTTLKNIPVVTIPSSTVI